MFYAKFLLFLILLPGLSATALAAAGDLDTTFGIDGIVITNNDGFTLEGIIDIAVQPDGKIVVIGYSHNEGTRRTIIARYTANGSLDTTFGTGGKVIILSREPGALALQPDGKIVFVSPDGSPLLNFWVRRLNSDGSTDTSFNGTGTVQVSLRGTEDRAYSVQIQPDGKIVVGGVSSPTSGSQYSDFAIVRFNSNGSLDTSFDGDGKVFTQIRQSSSQWEYLYSILLQPDGKIIAIGELGALDISYQHFLAVRYNSNGSLDTSFDGDGIVTTEFPVQPPSTKTTASAFVGALQSDGKLVLVGQVVLWNTSNILRGAVARYNTDGSLDASFGSGGKKIIDLPPFLFNDAYDIAIQPDDKIVIAGDVGNQNGRDTAVMRLNTDGSLDTSFSGDGYNLIQGPPNRFSPADAVAFQGSKIITGGFNGWTVGGDFMLARFESVTCTVNCVAREKFMDFDGDGKTDLSVYRSGTWFINSSSTNNPHSYTETAFGGPNPTYLAPADFDGDQKTDIGIWRHEMCNTTAAFMVLRSSSSTTSITCWGLTGDDPRVVGDWDGDGRADAAVYRNGAAAGAQSFFYYIPSSAPQTSVTIAWGISADESVRGDFDGDGKADAAVYRPSNQIWYVRKSSDSQPIFQYWGLATDKRVSGDFDGDGKTDFTAYRDGIWYVLQSSNNQPRYASWGIAGDKVVAGDYDGDGKTDFAVWRAGVYYVLQNANSQAVYHNFGIAGDVPVASVFVP